MLYDFPSELYANLCTQTQSRRRMQSRRNCSVQLHALFPRTTSKVDNMYFNNLVYLTLFNRLLSRCDYMYVPLVTLRNSAFIYDVRVIQQTATIFLYSHVREPFIIDTECVLYEVRTEFLYSPTD